MARSTYCFPAAVLMTLVVIGTACDKTPPGLDRDHDATRVLAQERGDNPCASVARVAITPAAPSVAVGDSVQIIATPLTIQGEPVIGCSMTWFRAEPSRSRIGGDRRVAIYAIVAVGAVAPGVGAAAYAIGTKNPWLGR